MQNGAQGARARRRRGGSGPLRLSTVLLPPSFRRAAPAGCVIILLVSSERAIPAPNRLAHDPKGCSRLQVQFPHWCPAEIDDRASVQHLDTDHHPPQRITDLPTSATPTQLAIASQLHRLHARFVVPRTQYRRQRPWARPPTTGRRRKP